ncbi:hypothetical protein Tco_0809120 [Tanacetum coccineum]
MEEINNFQQERDETLYQAWERFKELLMKCPQHYLTEMQEVILFYNRLDIPTRQILDSKGAIPTMKAADAKSTIEQYRKIDQEGASVSVMPLLTYLNLGLGELAHTRLTVELADRTVKYPKGIAENVLVGALMNVPIFVGTFSVVTDFAVLEDMDAYHDEGIGGLRSHPRFKHHTNEQCNKIPPLLKVSKEDEMNGISHAYLKLKGFYKGVLNLGPDYIQDAKTEEWLTCGHISVHEME